MSPWDSSTRRAGQPRQMYLHVSFGNSLDCEQEPRARLARLAVAEQHEALLRRLRRLVARVRCTPPAGQPATAPAAPAPAPGRRHPTSPALSEAGLGRPSGARRTSTSQAPPQAQRERRILGVLRAQSSATRKFASSSRRRDSQAPCSPPRSPAPPARRGPCSSAHAGLYLRVLAASINRASE